MGSSESRSKEEEPKDHSKKEDFVKGISKLRIDEDDEEEMFKTCDDNDRNTLSNTNQFDEVVQEDIYSFNAFDFAPLSYNAEHATDIHNFVDVLTLNCKLAYSPRTSIWYQEHEEYIATLSPSIISYSPSIVYSARGLGSPMKFQSTTSSDLYYDFQFTPQSFFPSELQIVDLNKNKKLKRIIELFENKEAFLVKRISELSEDPIERPRIASNFVGGIDLLLNLLMQNGSTRQLLQTTCQKLNPIKDTSNGKISYELIVKGEVKKIVSDDIIILYSNSQQIDPTRETIKKCLAKQLGSYLPLLQSVDIAEVLHMILKCPIRRKKIDGMEEVEEIRKWWKDEKMNNPMLILESKKKIHSNSIPSNSLFTLVDLVENQQHSFFKMTNHCKSEAVPLLIPIDMISSYFDAYTTVHYCAENNYSSISLQAGSEAWKGAKYFQYEIAITFNEADFEWYIGISQDSASKDLLQIFEIDAVENVISSHGGICRSIFKRGTTAEPGEIKRIRIGIYGTDNPFKTIWLCSKSGKLGELVEFGSQEAIKPICRGLENRIQKKWYRQSGLIRCNGQIEYGTAYSSDGFLRVHILNKTDHRMVGMITITEDDFDIVYPHNHLMHSQLKLASSNCTKIDIDAGDSILVLAVLVVSKTAARKRSCHLAAPNGFVCAVSIVCSQFQ